jgi:NAD(P)-dependent dehydrogenase (short-subunit alcohol dehydrogenase family)
MGRALQLGLLAAGGYVAYRMLRPRYRFEGKHVVITGGSRGLGLVLARQLIAAGARVSLCSRDPHELARALDDLESRGGRVQAVECDVTDPVRVREFFAVARQRHGPVDVLINNAGVIRVGPMEEMRAGDYEQSLRTYFWAALHTVNEAVPEMKARRAGRIVNIASIGGKIAIPHLLPYTAGKFALVGYSNGLRVELARHGIVVTTVCPGLMRTGSHLNAEFKGRHEEEYAWFATGAGMPFFSMSAECAARKILAACARGDAEVVLGLPAKLAVAGQALSPNLTSGILALVNRRVLPEEGGIGTAVAKGRESRGGLPPSFTALADRAAAENNELHAADVPPPVPVGTR